MSTIKTNTIQPTAAGNNLIFANGSAAETMRITNGGLVGIGTGSSPLAPLHVSGLNAEIRITTPGIVGADFAIFPQTLPGSLGTPLFRIFDRYNYLDRLTISSDGLVGIGTSSPTAKLHIKTANIENVGGVDTLADINLLSKYSLVLDATSAMGSGTTPNWNGAGIAFAASSNSSLPLASIFYGGDAAGGSLHFATSYTYANGLNKINMSMRNGKVGIGITGPTVALDVVGAGKFSQSVTIGGATFADPGGTAPIFGARALVVFDTDKTAAGADETALTATNRLIKHSGNVASVQRIAVGMYTITFTIPMPHANYVVICSVANNLQNISLAVALSAGTTTTATTSNTPLTPLQPYDKTVNGFTIHTGSTAVGTRADAISNPISVLVFA